MKIALDRSRWDLFVWVCLQSWWLEALVSSVKKDEVKLASKLRRINFMDKKKDPLKLSTTITSINQLFAQLHTSEVQPTTPSELRLLYDIKQQFNSLPLLRIT